MAKARKPGRPTVGDEPKDRNADRHVKPREAFHLDADLQAALVNYTESHRPALSKSAVIVTALEDFLAVKGFWKGVAK